MHCASITQKTKKAVKQTFLRNNFTGQKETVIGLHLPGAVAMMLLNRVKRPMTASIILGQSIWYCVTLTKINLNVLIAL